MHTQEEHLISDLTSFSECHFWRHMISPPVADRNPARCYLPGFPTVELVILPFPIINNLKCSMGKHSKAMQITYSLSKLPHDLVSVHDFFVWTNLRCDLFTKRSLSDPSILSHLSVGTCYSAISKSSLGIYSLICFCYGLVDSCVFQLFMFHYWT